LREVSHYSFFLTSNTFTFWGESRTTASLSYLSLSLFEGCLARNAFLGDSRCTKCCVLQDKTCLGRCLCGEACPADGCETVPAMLGSWLDRSRIGTASSGFIFTVWTCKIWRKFRTTASFSHLPLSDFQNLNMF
jgi:hypothetical protein